MRKALKETYQRGIIPLCRRNPIRAKDDSEDPTRAENDSQNPTNAEKDSQEADSFLCERCHKINFNEILSLKAIPFMGHHIFHFGSLSEIVKNPNCSFCQAFDFIFPSNSVRPSNHLSCSLVAVHSKDPRRRDWPRFKRDISPGDSIFLTIKVHRGSEDDIWRMSNAGSSPNRAIPGCLGLPSVLQREGDFFMADSIDRTVDFNMVRSWIETCEKKHGDYCASNSTQNSTLRLIECDSGRVVATPKPPEVSTYAALSYVWGSQESDEMCSKELPKQLPKTIEDAITATKSLGIPYLWIDRYCINQDDEREKHNQCSLMHRIYENAYVTIIAAAGSGPDHGLPGIGSSTRSYPSVRIGSHLLAPTLPDPRLSIQAAKWSTRGWTYQESKLSKRRLIFTDRQVIFLCRVACTDEAEQKLRPGIELPNGHFRPHTSLSPFSLNEEHPDLIWSEINHFSKLDLTRQEDCLNAMLGIFQRYQESVWEDGDHLRHLAGLPVVKKELSDHKRSDNHGYSKWTLAICKSLGWMTERAFERRDVPDPGFPSWSWTGWKADSYIIEDLSRPNYDPSTFYLNKFISVELPDGRLVKGDELDSLLEAGHNFSRIRFIHLKAPSLNFTISPKCPEGRLSFKVAESSEDLWCEVPSHSTTICHPVKLTDSSVHIPEDGLRCWGIMVAEYLISHDFAPSFLLVTNVEDWYERIGIAIVFGGEELQELETRTFRLG